MYTKEDYGLFIRDLIHKVPLMKTEQIITAINNEFDCTSDVSLNMLFQLQGNGRILLSDDGYSMTPGFYKMITGDKFKDGIAWSARYRLTNFWRDNKNKIGQKRISMMDMMWLVVATFPDSENFVIGTYPYICSFTTESDDETLGRLYQIIYIPYEQEDAICQQMKLLAHIQDDKFRDSTSFIVLMEKEHAWKVPYLGVSKICVLDDEEEEHFRIIEKRSREEMWKDLIDE